MESAARRVHAERNRQRLPYRSPTSRWGRRVIGLLATAGFVAVGLALALMVWPHKDSGTPAFGLSALPTATPTAHARKATHHHHRPTGPTKAQRLALANAQAALRQQGFTTLDAKHYVPSATLRVLTGRPVGDAGGGSYAFFFLRGTLLGKDAPSPSTKVRVVSTSDTAVTLEYGTYAAGDNACCPSGRAKVRFRLEGTQVRALDTIPSARFVRGGT